MSYDHAPINLPAGETPVATLTSGSVTITYDPDEEPDYSPESQSQLDVVHANYDTNHLWPSGATYQGDIPGGAQQLPRSGNPDDCDEIFVQGAGPTHNLPASSRQAWWGSVECIEQAIAATDEYALQGAGVATIYVVDEGGDTELNIDSIFQASNNQRRVVFVITDGVTVNIDRTLSSGDVIPSDRPVIEAAFVVNSDDDPALTFDGIFSDADPDPEVTADDSIMVEGPILTKSATFNRGRGLTNYYPSEVIKYNPFYLYKLTEQERDDENDNFNYSGLFVVDIDWESEE
jgi:hypothetical protein